MERFRERGSTMMRARRRMSVLIRLALVDLLLLV